MYLFFPFFMAFTFKSLPRNFRYTLVTKKSKTTLFVILQTPCQFTQPNYQILAYNNCFVIKH